jgi:hypothetical protein
MAATNVQAFSGDVEITSNLEVGTANLFVDTVSGNVGIGTDDPLSRLHVNLGNAAGEQHIRATQTSLATSTAGIRFGDSTWDAFIDHSHGSKDLINFGFYRNPTRQVNMVLTHEGNVGIGTNNPGAKLQVGDGNITSPAGTRDADASISIYGTGRKKVDQSKPGIYHRENVGLGLHSDYRMSFEINGSSSVTEAMRIDENGHVGIGTTNIGSHFALLVKDGAVPSAYPVGFQAVNQNRSQYYSYTFSGPTNSTAIQSRNFVVGGAERIGFIRVHKAAAASGSGNVQNPRSATIMFCPYGFGVRSTLQYNYVGSEVAIQSTGAFNGFRVRINGGGSYHQAWIEIYHPAGIYW